MFNVRKGCNAESSQKTQQNYVSLFHNYPFILLTPLAEKTKETDVYYLQRLLTTCSI